MDIKEYIIKGGEDLSSPPTKTAAFPKEAEYQFNRWLPVLGDDDSEAIRYLEIPIANLHSRLFIRSFWVEDGHRPVCYYVGFLLPKDFYLECGEYHCANCGLSSITLGEVKRSSATLAPLHVRTEWPRVAPIFWTPFEKLTMKLYGEEQFESNLKKMCSNISINNIDDWFERLVIAVNPPRLNQEFHLVISRKEPKPPIQEPNARKPSQRNISGKVVKEYIFHLLRTIIIAILPALVCLGGLYYMHMSKAKDYEQSKVQLNRQISELSRKVQKLETEVDSLKKRITKLEAHNKGNKKSLNKHLPPKSSSPQTHSEEKMAASQEQSENPDVVGETTPSMTWIILVSIIGVVIVVVVVGVLLGLFRAHNVSVISGSSEC